MPVAAMGGGEVFGDDGLEFMGMELMGIGDDSGGRNDEADVPTPQPAPKSTKPIVGIIYPPPEVRNIVDKTASFVARNGPDFETRIRQNEQNNAKFNFLSPGDPYHAYYQHKVKEIQEGKSAPSSQAGPGPSELLKPPQQLLDEKKKKQADLLKQVELPFVPKDPPAEFEFIADPPSISAHDLDVVKLTAQFVARNGRQFLSTLMTREQRNYQFDFLRPQHSLFQYFTKLLEQYTKVLIPPKDVVKNLSLETRALVLSDVKYRTNWIKHQEVQRRKVEEEAEKERLAYASIDWHDFVVVETVDYQPFEQGQFPPPTTPQEVGARVLLQDRILQGQVDKDAANEDQYPPAADDTQVQDMEEDSDSSSSDEEDAAAGKEPEASRIPPTAEPPREDQVIIKKGYDPKTARTAQVEKVLRPGPKPEEYTISPITGERIPVSKLQEHMRIGLLDPRWRDQRDRQLMEKVNQESVFAAGFAVDESLKQFAERRSDIFGVGVEETPIGKKVGEEERVPGMPWDPTAGLSSSIQAANKEEEANRAAEEAAKKEAIGPAIGNPPPPLLQPPAPATLPPLPQIPGIVRQLPMGMPQGQPGMLMMPGMQRVGVLPMSSGPPGFSPYNPAPPGTMPHRPPLLTPAPPVLPPMQHAPPPLKQMIPPQPVPAAKPPPPVEEEPPAKKAKTLEDSLIPEGVFFATNKSPANFQVVLPSIPDKPELNLSGQIVNVTMALSEQILLIKTKIHELIGLPPGKQKLSMEGLFYKDNKSLAFYNIGDGATIQMSLKERGGRKK